MIHVIATIQTKPGQRAALLAEFQQLVPAVRAEAGCMEYGPAIEVNSGIAVQSPAREDAVLVIEKWETLDALRAHLEAPHMHEFRSKAQDMIDNLSIMVARPH